MNPRFSIFAVALLIGLGISWIFFKDFENSGTPKEVRKPKLPAPVETVGPAPKSDRVAQSKRSLEDVLEEMKGLKNERILQFKDDEAYQRFLSKLGKSNLKNLGQLDRLRAIRVGYNDRADLDGLGLNDDDLSYNYPVSIPPPRDVEDQPNAVGFGQTALQYLGVTGDNSAWGTGVKVAVIDTGVQEHIALNPNITEINLVELPEGVEAHGHGTAVASLIAGTHPQLRGVAPGAEIIAVRVADETGFSNSFTLAEGIIAATDAGAQVINISMGSDSSSGVVHQAVKYAVEQGAVILASPGNDGLPNSAYPARYPEVISVAAIDAEGQHLNFSNTDEGMSIAAPGLDVTAAWPGNNTIPFTGTSGSVAFPSGAIAAIISESGGTVTGQQAAEILVDYANSAGDPGQDPQFGNGILDLGRIMRRDTPGVTDVAVAAQTYLLPEPGSAASGLQVTVENRGTETIFNSSLNVGIEDGNYPVQVNNLKPNESRTLTIPAGLNQLLSEGSLNVQSRITLPEGSSDIQRSNDSRSEVIVLPTEDTDGAEGP